MPLKELNKEGLHTTRVIEDTNSKETHTEPVAQMAHGVTVNPHVKVCTVHIVCTSMCTCILLDICTHSIQQ